MSKVKLWQITINSKYCPFKYQGDIDPWSAMWSTIVACRLLSKGSDTECNVSVCPKSEKKELLDKFLEDLGNYEGGWTEDRSYQYIINLIEKYEEMLNE